MFLARTGRVLPNTTRLIRPNTLSNFHTFGINSVGNTIQSPASFARSTVLCGSKRWKSNASTEDSKEAVSARRHAEESSSESGVDTLEKETNTNTETVEKSSEPKKQWYKLAFIYMVREPEKHADLLYDKNDVDLSNKRICVFYDRKPKAKKHLLILPNMLLQEYKLLNETHIDLLEEMQARGEQVIKEIKSTPEGKDLNFKTGFLAIPGMLQVHMHIISDDFDSPHMKNKRNWNSFNTEFFVPTQEVIDQLKSTGRVHFDKAKYSEILKQPMHCQECGKQFKAVWEAQDHIQAEHQK